MPTAVEEKEAIREVLAEYCFRLDDGRFDEMAALFTENGTWIPRSGVRRGGRRLPSWRAACENGSGINGHARSIW